MALDEKTEKVIEKIRKLVQNNAGRTEEEAQAFAAMAQELLIKHRLEMSDIQFSDFKVNEQVDAHFLDWTKHGVKGRMRRIVWIEDLAAFVANAYFCRILVHGSSSYISFVGRKSDARVAEFVLVTLVRQAEKIADAAYTRYFYECRDRGDVRAARGYRAAFLMGFVHRIAQRLAKRRAELEKESTALVRFSVKDIEDWMKSKDLKTSTELARPKMHTAGYQKGVNEANKVDLEGKAVEASSTRPRSLPGA